ARASGPTIASGAPAADLPDWTASALEGFINSTGEASPTGRKAFVLHSMATPEAAVEAGRDGSVAGAVVVARTPAGGLDFQVVTIGGLPQDKLLVLQLGTFAVGV